MPMVNPVAAGLSSMGAMAGTAGYSAFGVAIGMTKGPLDREVDYQLNAVMQNVVPDPQTCLGLYYAGRINRDSLQTLLMYHGIDYKTDEEAILNTESSRAWFQAVDLAAPRFDLNLTRQLYRAQIISVDEARDTMSRAGFSRRKDQEDFLSQAELMDANTLLNLLRLGVITKDEFARYISYLGISSYWVNKLEEGMKNPPSVSDSLAAFKRGIIDDPKLREYLRWNGITKQGEQDIVKKLSFQIPPPSDLILFSVREVWNDQVVQAFGYDEEFPAPFKAWMAKQGFDWKEDVSLPDGTTIPGVSWPEAYWRSHWKPISPGQAYTMLHRLRGNPDDPTTWRVPGVPPVTMDDVRTLLKVQDTPPAFRARLAAISYLPLRLVDIRNALAREISVDNVGTKADFAWAVEQFQDRGHSAATAVVQANMAVAIADERKGKKNKVRGENLHEKYILAIQANYRDGILTKQETLNALDFAKVPAEQAKFIIDLIDMQVQADMFRQVVRQIKRDFLAGRIDKPDMVARLTATGMTDEAKDKYVFTWERIKDEGHVFATAAKAIDFYKRGFLNYDQTIRRLQGLGLWAPDAIMLIEAANQDLAKLFGKAQEAEGKKSAAMAKELQRLADLSASLEKKLRAELRSITSVATIQKWLRKGIVSPTWAEHRLTAMGFSDDIVLKYLEDALPEESTDEVSEDSSTTQGTAKENGQGAGAVPPAVSR